MAAPKEPGGSGPSSPAGGNEADAAGKSSARAGTGRIPSLTPLRPVGPAATIALPGNAGKAPLTAKTGATKGGPAFKPNVTQFWTPPAQPGTGGTSTGFVRIATPITTRPDGVVSIISAAGAASARPAGAAPSPSAPSNRGGVVSISAAGGASGPSFAETPPFGISSLPSSPGAGSAAAGIPARVAGGRSARIPFRVGDYEVAMRIAQGGSGSIYVCRRANGPQPQSLLTLKVIRQHALAKDAAVFSFRREARVGELFRHANAHTVLDVGTYDGQPFLILPYVEGGDLASLLAGDSRPPPAVAVTALLDVLRALQHAHRVFDEHGHPVGLVHGDVSPDNILLGTDGVARLTDFGSAHFTAESAVGRTEDSFGFRKPAYASPEQLRGEPLDPRSDIFAIGVVMWTALTGQKLFVADTYDQTVMRVMRRKVPAPSSLGAPACLDDVCLQALRRSPEGRFGSASEMIDALMAVAVKADLVATRERVAEWVRRDIGDTLSERRRRIEYMFGGENVMTPGPVPVSPAPVGRMSSPAATIQMSAAGLGAVKNVPTPTMIIDTERTTAGGLSRRQWYVVVSVSVATFMLTLAVGSWISRVNSARRGLPPAAVSTPEPPPAPPPSPSTSVADLPATNAAAKPTP